MRKTVIILLSCTVLLLIGYAGLRGYRVWKRDHMMSLAREFAAKKDTRNAVLALNQVLRANPASVEANRLMAELAEASGSPEAFLWRSRVVQAAPNSTEDRLALARTALAVRDLTSASNALEGVTVEGKNTPGFHNIAGTVDIAGNQLTAAEEHFREASRLAPTNPVPRLNLAVIGLVNTNGTVAANARTTLEELSTNPSVSCLALRELVNDAVRRRQTNAALGLSSRLVQETNATFGDKLLRLDVLRGAKNPEFPAQLTAVQSECRAGSNLHAMGTWLMSRTGPLSALAWMDSLPPATRTNQPINMLAADCHLMLTNWPALQADIEKQNWGNLELLRHAFLARAMRGQELASTAKTEWELALKNAKGGKEALTMLLQLAGKWNWTSEAEQILWNICNQFPTEKWASASLAQLLYAGGRTDSLMRLYAQLSKTNPNDLSVKNNLAMLALLLDAKQLKPHELAREVYGKSPTNATYVSTYAFSLYRQDKLAAALSAIEHLEPEALEQPSIAAYYGVFLKATGHSEKAKTYLDLASKTTLLPEERKLVEQARGL